MAGAEFLVEAAVCCHMGLRRRNNEDNFYLNGVWKDSERVNENRLETCRAAQPALFAVCDGMGGQERGELASLLAVSWLHGVRDTLLTGPNPEETGRANIANLSRRLWNTCQKRGLQMGCTLAAAVLREDMLFLFHLGDSRIYLLERGTLRQMSQDHTLAAEAVYFGLTGGVALSPGDPRNHQLTQYFGMDCSEYDVAPSHVGLPLCSGQRLLLCSDGLSGLVDNGRIAAVLGQGTPAEAAQALVGLALEAGGTDNVTAMVVAV